VVAGVLHAAFKNITHPEFVADLLRAEALVFVSESEFPQFSFVPGRGGANFGPIPHSKPGGNCWSGGRHRLS
jgi:hypothetical protein